MWLPEDDHRIETCWRDFKCFNVKKYYVCALVGVLIEWLYEMHGATIKISALFWIRKEKYGTFSQPFDPGAGHLQFSTPFM